MEHIKRKNIITALCTVLSLCSLSAIPARAQQRPVINEIRVDDNSFDRIPTDLLAPPIRYRGFSISPKLTINQAYIDNVFFTDNQTQDDFVTEIQPSIQIIKPYRDHQLTFNANAKDRRHKDLTNENSTSYEMDTQLTLQATKSLKIPVRFRHLKSVLSRSAPGTSRFTETPLYAFRSVAQTGLDYTFNRVNVKLLGNYERRSFDNGTSVTTGQPITLSNNDRTTTGASLLASYSVPRLNDSLPEHKIFAGLTFAKQEFDAQANVDIRNNSNIGVIAGIKTRYKNIIIGDIGIGYITYDYDSDLAESINIIDIEADIDYLITSKLTLNFQAEREVNQDSDFVQGFIKTLYKLGAEYEFLHNLYGALNVTYENADFIGNAREDDTYSYEADLRYIHNPRLETRASILLETRDSNISGSDYNQAIMRVGIVGKL